MAEGSQVPPRVTVVDFDMPFMSMVVFMLKWAIAAIPAMLILVILGVFFAIVSAGVISGLGQAALWGSAAKSILSRESPSEQPGASAVNASITPPSDLDNMSNPRHLQSVIAGAGDSCDEVTRVFYQGGRPSTGMFWNAACRNGKSYAVSRATDGDIRVLGCAEMRAIAHTECFVALDK